MNNKIKVINIKNNTWVSTEYGEWLYSNEITGTQIDKCSYETIQSMIDRLIDINGIENVYIDDKSKVLLVKNLIEKELNK